MTQDVTIHSSCFPEASNGVVLKALRECLVPGGLHYRTATQTQHWLDLHRKYSPSRTDDECAGAYIECFREAATGFGEEPNPVVVGLGCGGGLKDSQMLSSLAGAGKLSLSYVPVDIGVPMVITAARTAAAKLPGTLRRPLVVDLAVADDLRQTLDQLAGRAARVVTFFGMIPNFPPGEIMPKLASLIRKQDTLLFSANLAPGDDYYQGTKDILASYDNSETRAWLSLFLKDVGFDPRRGEIEFRVEHDTLGDRLYRVVAVWVQRRPRKVRVFDADFVFDPGKEIRLFQSYRYTPERVRGLLDRYGLDVTRAWVAAGGEEGIFVCRRKERAL